jgi:hypothetical protein
MGERTSRVVAVLGVVDWLARIVVPSSVMRAYGPLTGVAAGVALVAVSEVAWRLLTSEWGKSLAVQGGPGASPPGRTIFHPIGPRGRERSRRD